MYQYKFNDGPFPVDTQITNKIMLDYINFVGHPLAGADGCVDWTKNTYNGELVANPAPVPPEPPAPYVPPAPTPVQIQAQLEEAVQQFMDNKAKSYGYGDKDQKPLISATSYAPFSSVLRFQTEGQAFGDWRSLVWEKCYAIMAEVLDPAIARPIPTASELIALLPPFVLDGQYPMGNDATIL